MKTIIFFNDGTDTLFDANGESEWPTGTAPSSPEGGAILLSNCMTVTMPTKEVHDALVAAARNGNITLKNFITAHYDVLDTSKPYLQEQMKMLESDSTQGPTRVTSCAGACRGGSLCVRWCAEKLGCDRF